jgi:hypothetical protein
MGSLDPGCVLLVQYHDVILMINEEAVFVGTVTGNTAAFPLETESNFINVSGAITLVLMPGNNALTGLQIMTLSNPEDPQDNCMINVAIVGNRETGCKMATSFGGLQLLR